MTLPGFLIIGAMKAGTTTLFRDLRSHPDIFMPGDKEPHCLVSDDVLTEAGRVAYERYFDAASPGQLCGEASTGYTKLPDVTGVPARALAVLGPDVKLVYIVRDPVTRVVSHYFHDASEGKVAEDIDEAVHTYAPLLDYSRYAMQLEPWLETFGPEALHVIRFEDYVADRAGTVDALNRFLGVASCGDLVDTDRVYNRGSGKPLTRGPGAVIQRSRVYQKLIRPLLPLGTRDRLRDMLLPKAGKRPPEPAPETKRFVREALREDSEALRKLIGADETLWG